MTQSSRTMTSNRMSHGRWNSRIERVSIDTSRLDREIIRDRGAPEGVAEPVTLVASRARARAERRAARQMRLPKPTLRALSSPTASAAIAILATVAVGLAAGVDALLLIAVALGFAGVRRLTQYLTGLRRVFGPVQRRHRWQAALLDELKVATATFAVAYLVTAPVAPIVLVLMVGLNVALQLGWWRVIQHYWRLAPEELDQSATTRVVIAGTGKRAKRVADMLLDSTEEDSTVVGFIDNRANPLWRYRDVPLLGTPDMIRQLVGGSQMDALMLAVEPEQLPQMQRLIEEAERMGLPVCVMPECYGGAVGGFAAAEIAGKPALVLRAVPESRFAKLAKATIDRLGAVVGIVLTAPIMAICAALIKLESRGPILFTQVRAGINGRPFQLYKFRTMCADAERKKATLQDQNEMSGPVFKIKEDPRITTVGRFLRKYSLDELPQFFNILKGDMSLVGPRPPLPREVVEFAGWQRRKLSVKPGLTCLWQVNGRNEIDFEDWMRLDLEYIDTWSLANDVRLIARTVPTVIKGSGM
ncbi:exopolysaccharide biosynthesis polyprenyl glycosylphosphotransferase [candidate division GN15 bacterium]|nr:exopolysaccharide biosynthesis polyprenyl glycosylphosphotransferase [candidate division GN15 bacterium]